MRILTGATALPARARPHRPGDARRGRPARDRGAIGVTIGVLLGVGVLLGAGAAVVDVGRLYQERAELQNGADAGALAVARGCARGVATCLAGTAASYANSNAKDGSAAVELVCGTGLTPAVGCPAPTSAMTSCGATPSPGARYVEVHTATRTGGGSTLLPPSFAGSLPGNGAYDGSTVRACARASWGGPATASTVAMTISYCEWMVATGQGTSYAQAPPYPPNTAPSASSDRVLRLHGASGASCPGGPAGGDAPGAFGWVMDSTGACSVSITGGTYVDDTGASAGNSCKNALAAARSNRTVIYVPVYTKVTGTGSNARYTLAGFGAFVVTGYHLPGAAASDWLNPANDCRGNDKCINGYFTRALMPGNGTAGGPDLGATVIQLSG